MLFGRKGVIMGLDHYTVNIVCAVIETVLVLFLVVLFVKYHSKFDEYIAAIDKKTYFLTTLFFLGYGMNEMLRIDTKTGKAKKKIKDIAQIQGEYAEFYYYTKIAAQFTYCLVFLPIAFFLGAVTGDLMMAGLGITASFILPVYFEMDIASQLFKRQEELMQDFPHVLSQMSLLLNAGMPLREVMRRLSVRKDTLFYQELRTMVTMIDNGDSEYDAMRQFADRCGVPEIRKFSLMVMQNISRGSEGMADSLKEMSDEIWNDRKNHVRQLGEKVSARLLIPIMMIFGGILIMVIVPSLSSFQF